MRKFRGAFYCIFKTGNIKKKVRYDKAVICEYIKLLWELAIKYNGKNSIIINFLRADQIFCKMAHSAIFDFIIH
jgi:hypothetical protein